MNDDTEKKDGVLIPFDRTAKEIGSTAFEADPWSSHSRVGIEDLAHALELLQYRYEEDGEKDPLMLDPLYELVMSIINEQPEYRSGTFSDTEKTEKELAYEQMVKNEIINHMWPELAPRYQGLIDRVQNFHRKTGSLREAIHDRPLIHEIFALMYHGGYTSALKGAYNVTAPQRNELYAGHPPPANDND